MALLPPFPGVPAAGSVGRDMWAAPARLCVRKERIQAGDFLWGLSTDQSHCELRSLKDTLKTSFVRKEDNFSVPRAPWGLPNRFPASERASSLCLLP